MRKFVMAVALALMPGVGAACTLLQPFEMTQIAGADLVLVGKVTGYEDLGTPQGTALVTLHVEEVLKGTATVRGSIKGSISGSVRAGDEVVLVWNSGMAMGPHESRAKGRVLVGAMAGARIAVSDMVPDERPDLPAIVQPLCGEVWMQRATRRTVAEARKVLE